MDNEPEFISQVVDQWAYRNRVSLHFIESFNGKFRDECLNQSWFTSLEDALRIIEAWREDYNTVRPHSSLGSQDTGRIRGRSRRATGVFPKAVVSIRTERATKDVQEPQSVYLWLEYNGGQSDLTVYPVLRNTNTVDTRHRHTPPHRRS